MSVEQKSTGTQSFLAHSDEPGTLSLLSPRTPSLEAAAVKKETL